MTMGLVSAAIMQLLADNGLGTIGVDLFATAWGDDVDKQVLILDTDGGESELKTQYEQPHFQVLARGAKSADTVEVYDEIRAVYEFLIQQSDSVNIGGVCYKGFEPMSAPYGLGRDENGRMVYSTNFYTYRNPV
jgi:hypothetical protein